MRKYYLTLSAIFIATFLALLSCGGRVDKFDVESYEDIESITQFNIKRLDEIRIVFLRNVEHKSSVGKAIRFSPNVAGSYNFVDEKTLVFTPSSPYKGGSELTMSVDLGLLLEGKAGKRGFVRNFLVSPPSVFVDFLPIKLGSEKDSVEITGSIETDIPQKLEDLKNIFIIKREDGKELSPLNVEIESGLGETSYNFYIKEIKKEDVDVSYTVSYDSTSLGSTDKGSRTYSVLSKNTMEAMSYTIEDGNTIYIHFSSNLARPGGINDPDDLVSFVVVESDKNFTYYIKRKDNKIRLNNNIGMWPDNCKITVLKGIKGEEGGISKKDYTFVLKDSYDAPKVEFETVGNIVPSKDNATVLIRTLNIKGVYMRAVNVYGHNMLQFLQENNIGSSYYLEPVGESVWEGNFKFEWKEDMKNRYVVRALDITELVKKFPTGMFNLQIAFSKDDVVYVPKNAEDDFSYLPFPPAKFYKHTWDGYEEYWELHGSEIGDARSSFWKNASNPCHPAFYLNSYNDEIVAKKDILVSNIAVMAKKEVSGNIHARVCDIRTGALVDGAEIRAFSFAQRELQKGRTDKNGSFTFKDIEDVAFIQAEKDESFAYLKLKDGNEIAVGHFAVEGDVPRDGVKGYIYGERGVWRPGDDIHLCFMLQDEKGDIPKDIPVEFSLLDPFSTEVDRQVLKENVGGIYRIDTKTKKEGKTGAYIARVKIGGNTWTRTIKVETIVPNRLFVELSPNGMLKQGYNSIHLSSKWLHGAKASGLRAEIDCKYSINRKPFNDWSQYSFIATHEVTNFTSNSENLWQGVLNEAGEADVSCSMKTGSTAPGKLKAMFETRVYEGGGAFSVENRTFDFSPYPAYVGMLLPEGRDSYRERMLQTGKENTVNFVVVDPEGNLIKAKRSFKVDLYRLEWRWWWEDNAYDGSMYASSSSIKNVSSAKIYTEAGKASWTFNISDEDWGRYMLICQDENGGHTVSSVIYVDTPYWARRASEGVGLAETILQMQAGKEKYKAGEIVEITFPSSKDAFAYVTLEKAGRIVESTIVPGSAGMAKYTFKADATMAPNVYVHVSLVQPYKNVKNSLPIRLYGVLPVSIENETSRIKPMLVIDGDFESNKKGTFKVKEQNGTSMAFTVAIVDEGLLGLTGFRQANPWNYFYKKEASSLASFDMFNSISGAFGGRIESLLAIGGGDDEEGGEGSKKAERFKSVAMLLGPYEIGAKEEKTIEFEMPQYVGAVRVMLVGKNGKAYGVEEKTVAVTSSLIVLPTFPRVIGLDEEMEVPVTVFNGRKNAVSVKVALKGEGAINIREEKSVNVGATSEQIVKFNIKGEKSGNTTFSVEGVADNGDKNSSVISLDSVLRGAPYFKTMSFLLDGGKEEDINIELPGENDTRELILELSRLPSIALEQRLSYLNSYHSYCLEQLISKGFSQIYLPMFLELDEKMAETRKNVIKKILEVLPSYQTSSGGFSYWPSSREPSLWASVHAGHFMTEAKKMGFTVEDSLYTKFLEYSVDLAKTWSIGYKNDPDIQAYRLYVLTLAGRSELQAMNKLKGTSDLSSLAKSLLAAAYAVIGKKDVGKGIANDVTLNFSYNNRGLKNYGSTVRDVAMQLHAYTLLEVRNKEVDNCIVALANESSSNSYLSTDEIAWLLIALAPYYNNKKTSTILCDVFTKGEKQEVILNLTNKIARLKVNNDVLQEVRVANKSSELVYVSLTAKSVLAPKDEKNESTGSLHMSIKYTDLTGTRTLSPHNIKQGERFLVHIEAKNNANIKMHDLVLNYPIPTGWELKNERMGNEEATTTNYEYQDIRDTNVYTYFSLSASEAKTFRFEGVAVYEGKYNIPALVLESMYDPLNRVVLKN